MFHPSHRRVHPWPRDQARNPPTTPSPHANGRTMTFSLLCATTPELPEILQLLRWFAELHLIVQLGVLGVLALAVRAADSNLALFLLMIHRLMGLIAYLRTGNQEHLGVSYRESRRLEAGRILGWGQPWRRRDGPQ